MTVRLNLPKYISDLARATICVMIPVHIHTSRFPSLGIPSLELKNPRWNTYVGHWNSYVGILMSNVGIPTWVFSFLPRFLPNLMIFIIWMNLSSFIGTNTLKNHQIWQKSGQKWEKPRWNSYVGHWNSNVGIPMSNIGILTWVFQLQPRNSEARAGTGWIKSMVCFAKMGPIYKIRTVLKSYDHIWWKLF